MSPLVRSLLALAALLAAAQAQSNCATQLFGVDKGTPYEQPPVYLPPGGGTVHVPDPCRNHSIYNGSKRGETVTACNNDPNGPAPVLSLENPPNVDDVDILCPDDYCPYGVTVYITLYCDYV